jgi:hypothetical protein
MTVADASTMVVGSQVVANAQFPMVASSILVINGQRRQSASLSIACISSMSVSGNLKWLPENDVSETWTATSDTDETWTPITDGSETWTAIDDSSKSWTAVADNSETWQIAA